MLERGAVIVLTLVAMVLGTLMILVPQLLRSHMRKVEMLHAEHMLSLEKGIPIQTEDNRSLLAGRTAMLVPMVVLITAGTVTGFLAAFESSALFTVSISVWVVAGVVSLAAITGGVALIGQLAQIQAGQLKDEEDFTPDLN